MDPQAFTPQPDPAVPERALLVSQRGHQPCPEGRGVFILLNYTMSLRAFSTGSLALGLTENLRQTLTPRFRGASQSRASVCITRFLNLRQQPQSERLTRIHHLRLSGMHFLVLLVFLKPPQKTAA